MTDQIKVTQALLQVEADLTPQIKVTQALVQVEGGSSPLIKVTQFLLQVEYTKAGGVVIASGGIEVGGPTTVFTSMVPPAVPHGAFSVRIIASGSIAVGGPTTIYSSMPQVIGPVIPVGPSFFAVQATGSLAIGGETEVIFARPVRLLVQADTGSIAVGGPAAAVMGRPTHALISASGYISVGGPAKAIFAPAISAKVVQVISGSIAVGGPATVLTQQLQGYLVVASQGGIQVGDRQAVTVIIGRPQTGVVEVLWGGIEVGGQTEISRSTPAASYLVLAQALGEDSGIKVGGATGPIAFIHPSIMRVIATGFIAVGGEPDLPPDEVYDTYALNGNAYEPSIFSGWNFNSYAMFRGKAYGAGAAGLYFLEGADDDGEVIHTGARIGPINFGTTRDKRLRVLKLGPCGDDVQVKVSTERGQEGWFDVEDEGRVPVSRDIQGKNFTLDISDFTELSQAEMIPLVLVGR